MQATLEVDDHHWWYRGRRRVIRSELDQLPIPLHARLLDAGCGSGRTMVELTDYGVVSGLELDPDAAQLARDRELGEVVVGRVEELPWEPDCFDLITCLDVIEHTPDDRRALVELRRVCRPGGFLLITVPAYQALWSRHDEVNHHYRRYSRRMLRAAAEEAGWALARLSAFNSLLLPPAAVMRLAQRWGPDGDGAGNDLHLAPWWLNGTLELPLRLEAAWLGRRLTLPAGLSLVAVLRKPWTAS